MYEFGAVFSDKATEILLLSIQELLKDNGFISILIKRDQQNVLLIRQTSMERIEATFEELQFEFPRNDMGTLKLREQKSRNMDKYKKFIDVREFLPNEIKEMEMYSRFKQHKRNKFLKAGEINYDQYHREIAVYHQLAKLQVNEQIRGIVKEIQQNSNDNIKYLFVYLLQGGLMVDLCPLRTFRHSTIFELKNFYKQGVLVLDFIVNSIKEQLGEQIAIYFAFLLYLIKHMTILVVMGLVTYAFDEYYQWDVNTSPVETLYAVLTVFWGAYFIGKWLIRQKQLQILWRSTGPSFDHYQQTLELSLLNNLSHEDKDIIEQSINQSQHLSTEIDPITGNMVHVNKRLAQQIIKAILVSAPYIISLIVFLVASLNARGYMKSKEAFLHIHFLQDMALEGAIFDANTWRSFILTVIHVLVVNVLTIKYKEASIKTSLLEGHKSYQGYEKSLIIKRFLFETFSAFTDFFYIGFVLNDIAQLKYEMVSMFAVDEIRRVLFETVIPTLQKVRLSKFTNKLVHNLNNNTVSQMMTQVNETNKSKFIKMLNTQLVSIYLPKYEAFDDYLEIILNFGYLCFFTSAYRMAGIVIAIFLLMEFFSDYYKLYHLYQKPFALKCRSIGPWARSIDIICVVSVYTNLVLFSLASDKIVEFFPWLFQDDAPQDFQKQYMLLTATPKSDKAPQMVAIIFIIEHVLLLIILLIRMVLKSRITWADIYLGRKAYKPQIRL